MPVCTAEECEGTVSNTICIHMHHSAYCEAEALEANNMVVPTIQVIGVVPPIVFFLTLEWLALLLVLPLLVVVSSGGLVYLLVQSPPPEGITPMIEQHFLWIHP